VYVFAGQQLDLAFETLASPEFLRRSLGVVITLVIAHVLLLVLLLRIQLKPQPVTAAYLQAVRSCTAFSEILMYLEHPPTEKKSTEDSIGQLLNANAVRLNATGDVVKELMMHRIEKLRRNKISRVKGWRLPFRKMKIVSEACIASSCVLQAAETLPQEELS
jgi:hypothetical protein